MISPEQKQLLENLSKSPFGTPLKDYLNEKLVEINDVTTVTSFDDALGRKHAIKLIRELFIMMEEKTPVNKEKNQYR